LLSRIVASQDCSGARGYTRGTVARGAHASRTFSIDGGDRCTRGGELPLRARGVAKLLSLRRSDGQSAAT
jgi:hypothetical protein